MDKESLEKARRQLVAKRNDLVQNARQPLTKIQNEVIQYMVSKVKPTDMPGTEYLFKCNEFYSLMGYVTTSYTDIKALLSAIRKVNWWVDGENGEDDKNLTWFDIVHANPKKETVTISFHKDIEPYIFQLVEQKANFSSYPFQYISLMKSFYSQKLYEQLNTHKHDRPRPGKRYPEWIYEIGTGSKHDLFIRIAQAAPELDQRVRWDRKTKKTKIISKYDGFEPGEPMIPDSWKNFAIFKRDVLEPAIKEINMYTDMMVMYEPLKTDLAGNKYRRYTSIRFSWIIKSEGQIEETEKTIDDEYQKIEEARVNHQYTLDELYGSPAEHSLQDKMDQLQKEQDQFEKVRKKAKKRKEEQTAEEEIERRADKSYYPVATSTFGNAFTDDQLNFLYGASWTHLPVGTIEFSDRDLWLTDYISHYKKLVDATPEDTKTTTYKRLLDMLRKDYEGVGPVFADQYRKKDPYTHNFKDSRPLFIHEESEAYGTRTAEDEDSLQKTRMYLKRIENTRNSEVK